jgi:tRNA pseudouridine38-40 synthase
VNATQRWRLDLAYDGSTFQGFALQPDHVTVVGLLREVLASTLRLDDAPYVVGAGRTDTGVHAFAQVVHVDLPASVLSLERSEHARKVVRGLNAQFKGRLRVTRAMVVRDDFDARRSARWREYRYLVLATKLPALAFADHWAWPVEGPLDLAAMNDAAQLLCGEHDFRAFCRRAVDKSPDDPIVRVVTSAQWRELDDALEMSVGRAPVAKLTIRAQSFCHRMVRSVTSTMVAIGQGRLEVDEITRRLASHDRAHLPPPAPASGLALVGVGYDDVDGGPSGSAFDVARSTQIIL